MPVLREIIWLLHGDAIIAKIQSIARKRTEQFNRSPKHKKLPGQSIKLSPSDFDVMIDHIRDHFIVEILSLPILYFFVFLFYTDIPSVFWLLCGYLVHLKLAIECTLKSQVVALAVGFIAILHRQTNVIWIGFYFLCSLYDCFVAARYGQIDRTQYHLHDFDLNALIVMIRWCWTNKVALIQSLWFDVVLF